jgi:hypothetical protein
MVTPGHRSLIVVLAAIVLALAVIGCSSDSDGDDDDASTCASLQQLSASVRALSTLDLSAEGTNGLQSRLETIEDDWSDARQAAADQFGGELDELEQAVDTLGATLDSLGSGDQTLGALADQVRSDVQAVDAAWRSLVEAAEEELSDCDLDTAQ